MVDDEATSPAQESPDLKDDDDDDEVDVEKNVTDDVGLKKKIITVGTGWERPAKGDSVTVHYTGTLLSDGSKFDSSRDRDEPFTFTLGQGSVIKGWDVGVATMRKGEKSMLTCKADYAYGAQGSPPKIPANATLCFEVELISWQSVSDICGNGGVIKTTIVDSNGWQKPGDIDECLVTFAIYEHVEQKSSGKEAGPPFGKLIFETGQEGARFCVLEAEAALAKGGKPTILKGIIEAVKTMKKGEVARLTLKPEYAYGSEGNAPDVPPDATVDVHLELVRWNRMEDVSEDGGVVKKTIHEDESNSYNYANEGAKVTVRYTGRLSDGSIFDQHGEGDEFTFTTDEGEVPEGLELAVVKMTKGEIALVTIKPEYAFGEKGFDAPQATVPPGETVCYEVEVVEIVKSKDAWEMNDEDKVASAEKKKEKGNKAFKEGNLKRASSCYQKASAAISIDKNFSEELKRQSQVVKKSCFLNLAAVGLKLKDYKEVKSNCAKVLEMEPSNMKALYRRAQAYHATQDYQEAEADVKKGLLDEPTDKDLLILSKRIKVSQKESDAKAAKMYSKMFAPSKSKPADEKADKDGVADGGQVAEGEEAKQGGADATTDMSGVLDVKATIASGKAVMH